MASVTDSEYESGDFSRPAKRMEPRLVGPPPPGPPRPHPRRVAADARPSSRHEEGTKERATLTPTTEIVKGIRLQVTKFEMLHLNIGHWEYLTREATKGIRSLAANPSPSNATAAADTCLGAIKLRPFGSMLPEGVPEPPAVDGFEEAWARYNQACADLTKWVARFDDYILQSQVGTERVQASLGSLRTLSKELSEASIVLRGKLLEEIKREVEELRKRIDPGGAHADR